MTTLVVCALLAVLMPYFAKIPVAIAMAKEPSPDRESLFARRVGAMGR